MLQFIEEKWSFLTFTGKRQKEGIKSKTYSMLLCSGLRFFERGTPWVGLVFGLWLDLACVVLY